jgi:hypothetical protein
MILPFLNLAPSWKATPFEIPLIKNSIAPVSRSIRVPTTSPAFGKS